MRIHLQLSSTNQTIPYNYQEKLTGVFHKWLGENRLHGNISLYSFSQLGGAKVVEKGLTFPNGAKWFISSYDDNIMLEMLNGLFNDPEMFYGLKVVRVENQPTPNLKEKEVFRLASPVLVKRNENGNIKHYTFAEEISDQLMTETMHSKMDLIGMKDDTLEIKFDRSYKNTKTKVITYNGVGNRVNVCPIIIKGKLETKAFAWNVGIGNSTGIGFGAVE